MSTLARIRKLAIAAVLVTAASHCTRNVPEAPSTAIAKARVASATLLTNDCAASRLSGWNVRGTAAGTDCGVLLVETPMILEDSIVEAMHYGTGAYDLYRGGIYHFSRSRSFRGVAYRDGSGKTWTYGAVSDDEVAGLKPCR